MTKKKKGPGRPKVPGRTDPKERAANQTTLTISLPTTMKEDISYFAGRHQRDVSSWCRLILDRVIKLERLKLEREQEQRKEIDPEEFLKGFYGSD
jgi:hypothetical protein